MSPLQQVKHDRDNAFSTQKKDSPVREEIEKCIGEHKLIAYVEEDVHTLVTMKHITGLIAFLCTLTRDGKVIAQGSGASILNATTNRWMKRNVLSAFHSSIIDAVMKATKILGTLSPIDGVMTVGNIENLSVTPITEKQATYLQQLIQDNVPDIGERRKQEARIPHLSKQEASELIASYR